MATAASVRRRRRRARRSLPPVLGLAFLALAMSGGYAQQAPVFAPAVPSVPAVVTPLLSDAAPAVLGAVEYLPAATGIPAVQSDPMVNAAGCGAAGCGDRIHGEDGLCQHARPPAADVPQPATVAAATEVGAPNGSVPAAYGERAPPATAR